MIFNPKNAANVSEISQQAADWFAKLQSGHSSEHDQYRFQRWLASDPAHQKAYDDIINFWNDPALRQSLSSIPLTNSKNKSPQSIPNRLRFVIPLLAASFLIATVMFQGTWNCLQADYCAGTGEVKRVDLADGSTVTLNAQTAIKVNYQSQLRQIELIHGEALFEVKRNPTQPFVVKADYSQTKVLGTRFTVRENQDSDIITVIEGTVEVSPHQHPPYLIKANDQILVGNQNPQGIKQVNTFATGAWIQGHLVFDNANLESVVNEIERYRSGKVIIKNNRLKSIKVSGRFDIRHPDKALEALEQTLPIKLYRLTQWLVVVT